MKVKKLFLGIAVAASAVTLFSGSTTVTAQETFDVEVAYRAWATIAQLESANGLPKGLLGSMSLVETGKGMNGRIMPWPYTVGVNPTARYRLGGADVTNQRLDRLRKLGFTSFNVWTDENSHYGVTASQAEEIIEESKGKAFRLQGRHFSKRFATARDAADFAGKITSQGYENIDVGVLQINWRYHKQNFGSLVEAFDPYANANYAVSYLRKHRDSKLDWWSSVGRYHSKKETYAKRYIRNVWAIYKRLHEGASGQA